VECVPRRQVGKHTKSSVIRTGPIDDVGFLSKSEGSWPVVLQSSIAELKNSNC